MKKIIFIVVMLLMPCIVNAEECSQDILNSYTENANKVKIEYEATSNPDTYKVYVYGLTSGLSFNGYNGRQFDNGYYGFFSAGEKVSITVDVSDGSACALKTIRTVSTTIPVNNTVPPIPPPTEEKPYIPPTENNNQTNNDQNNNSSIDNNKPSTNNPEPKEELPPINNLEKEEDSPTLGEDENYYKDNVEKETKKQVAKNKLNYLFLSIPVLILGILAFLLYKRKKRKYPLK